jgi:hypothetical protein
MEKESKKKKGNKEKKKKGKTLMAGKQQNNCLSRKEVKERRKQKPGRELSGINVLPPPSTPARSFCVFQLVGRRRSVLGVISLSQQGSYFCLVAFPNVTCRGVV